MFQVLQGFTGFYKVLLGIMLILQGFTGFYWVLLGFTGFYWVLLGFTGFSWAVLSHTDFYWVILVVVAILSCCCFRNISKKSRPRCAIRSGCVSRDDGAAIAPKQNCRSSRAFQRPVGPFTTEEKQVAVPVSPHGRALADSDWSANHPQPISGRVLPGFLPHHWRFTEFYLVS